MHFRNSKLYFGLILFKVTFTPVCTSISLEVLYIWAFRTRPRIWSLPLTKSLTLHVLSRLSANRVILLKSHSLFLYISRTLPLFSPPLDPGFLSAPLKVFVCKWHEDYLSISRRMRCEKQSEERQAGWYGTLADAIMPMTDHFWPDPSLLWMAASHRRCFVLLVRRVKCENL